MLHIEVEYSVCLGTSSTLLISVWKNQHSDDMINIMI